MNRLSPDSPERPSQAALEQLYISTAQTLIRLGSFQDADYPELQPTGARIPQVFSSEVDPEVATEILKIDISAERLVSCTAYYLQSAVMNPNEPAINEQICWTVKYIVFDPTLNEVVMKTEDYVVEDKAGQYEDYSTVEYARGDGTTIQLTDRSTDATKEQAVYDELEARRKSITPSKVKELTRLVPEIGI